MVLGAASMASAATYDLFRVVYNTGDKEVGLNLGQVDILTNGTYGAGSVGLANFSASNWSQVKVAYIAGKFEEVVDEATWEVNTVADAWWGNATMLDPVNPFAGMAISGSSSAVVNYASKIDGLMGGATVKSWSSSNLQSLEYSTGGAPMFLGNWVGTPTAGISLEPLATGGTADMYLYHAKAVNGVWDIVDADTKFLTMAADGSVTVADVPGANPVPVPGAVWLLGSGVVGLIGIRRKNS